MNKMNNYNEIYILYEILINLKWMKEESCPSPFSHINKMEFYIIPLINKTNEKIIKRLF